MATRVLLCHAAPAPAAPGADAWLPLTESYATLRGWQETLGPPVAGVNLQATAAALRRPFLDTIAELGRAHASPEWWTSRTSERNTQVSPLFLGVCWLRMAEQALASTDGTLAVVSDSTAVLEAVAERAGVPVTWASRPSASRAGALARLGRFLARGAWHSIRRRKPRAVPAGRPLALIRTWVDDASLADDGSFRDRYFPGLREGLERLGFAVVTIPVPFSLKRSTHDLWLHLDRAEGHFLAPESYLRFADYLYAARAAWRQRRLPRGRVTVDGSDVTRLVREDRRRFAFDAGSLDALLYGRLPRRLRMKGLRPALVIETYENLISEKGLVLGIREALPQTKVVGFQHGALSPLLLSSFVTSGEAGVAPLPDRVVCNGEFFRDLLVAEGLPGEVALAGPALRYAHLWEQEALEGHRERAVLVTLPLIIDGAAELLTKVAEALGSHEDVAVWIKAHPMLRESERKELLRGRELPARFEWVSGGMGDWLGRAGTLVALASSTLYEGLAAGVPVVVVGRDAGLDLNPLAWEPELAPVARTPSELEADVLRLLDLRDDELGALRERGRRVLEASFGRVTSDAARAFVDGLVELPRG